MGSIDLIITSGQHRNEKSAIVFAPLVANSLRHIGYNVLLLSNPEKRTLLQVARAAYMSGKRIKKAEVKRWLHEWEDKQVPARKKGIPLFQFHNYGINPTDFVPAEDHYLELKSINAVYSSMDSGDFNGDELAYKLKYCGDGNGALIEIPEITKTKITPFEIKMLKRVFHHQTFAFYRTYFLSTDLKKTREEGLMGDEIVRRLTYGIDYLLHTRRRGK